MSDVLQRLRAHLAHSPGVYQQVANAIVRLEAEVTLWKDRAAASAQALEADRHLQNGAARLLVKRLRDHGHVLQGPERDLIASEIEWLVRFRLAAMDEIKRLEAPRLNE